MRDRSDDPLARKPWQRVWGSLQQRHVGVACAVFCAIVLAAVARNQWILTDGRIEDGDFAVNSILIDKALHFRLLIGNYSRVGFNHPGPALLYVQAAGQFLFYKVLHLAPRPYNAHVLSIVVFCASMAASACSIVSRRTRSALAGCMVLAVVLLIDVVQRGAMVSTSFPEVYIWAYLLLTVASASVLSGEPRDLPWTILAIGLLCHGHVSFVLFGAGFLAAIVLYLRWRRHVHPIPAQALVKSAAIAGVFLLPFVVNLALHWPGELGKYWRYSRSSESGGHAWSAILRFVASFWSVQGAFGYALVIGFLVATVLLIWRFEQPWTDSLAFGLVVSTMLSTVLLLMYAAQGIDDLAYRYVAEFYLNAPAAALLALGLVCVPIVTARRVTRFGSYAGLAVAVLVFSLVPQVKALYPGANWIANAEVFLDRSIPSDRTRIMRFPLDVWPGVAGIVEESRRSGHRVCIEEAGYGFLFNNSTICTVQQLSTGIVVQALPPGTPNSGSASVKSRYDSPHIVLEVQNRNS